MCYLPGIVPILLKSLVLTWRSTEKISAYVAKNKNTIVFGNAGDEKNLHMGGRKFIF